MHNDALYLQGQWCHWYEIRTVVLQETFNCTATSLIQQSESTTIQQLVSEIIASSKEMQNAPHVHDDITQSMWIAPSAVSVKMRLFCFPYAGGISENVFAR